MSREISADFQILEVFIQKFNLSTIAGNQELLRQIKPMHKKLYSLTTFVVEVNYSNKNGNLFTDNGLRYLKESVSDLGQALFCWIQGAYKPSNLILRSSIETFIKSISGEKEPTIYQEKSMYKVFDIAKDLSFFQTGIGEKSFDSLHTKYKDLCKVVHAATFDDLVNISALNSFPIFSNKNANTIYETFIVITTAMLSVLYSAFYKFVHTMHPKNQSNFLDGLPKGSKKDINEKVY